jgi:hypothetical protein
MAHPRSDSRVSNRPLVLFLTVALCATILGLTPRVTGAGPLVDCYVSGPITIAGTEWDLSCNWIMYGNVTVEADLTILPGAYVLADPGVFLYVEGVLAADGNSASPITFDRNGTSITPDPWGGIQFNASSVGSVSWSTFDRVERAVTAVGSSPSVHDNTVFSSVVGFAFVASSESVVEDNDIRQARVFGVFVQGSNVTIRGNAINNTPIGIQAEQPGSPVINDNTITNVSGSLAIGIFVLSGATADISGNTVRVVRGANGVSGIGPGARGGDGGLALAIYVNSAPWANVTANTIEAIFGGIGGNGAANFSGPGGRGGDGGAAAGILVAGAPNASIQGNLITTVRSGRGGVGGGGGTTPTGGRGGDGGDAAGIEVAFTMTSADVFSSSITEVTGGSGGSGGAGTAQDGSGGFGGDAYGTFFIAVASADASSNGIQTVRGGFGGNSTASVRAGNGGQGGDAAGISAFSVLDSAIVHSNSIDTLAGGQGGSGRSGGHGGNATGVVAIGNNDGLFNATPISSNYVTTVTGGAGGNGLSSGGAGGTATGIGAVLVTPTLGSNSIWTLQGGRGGNAIAGGTGGRGGDAVGIIGGLLQNGGSSVDSIDTVTKGGAGSPGTPPASLARGFYLVGNATTLTRFTVENGTLESVDNFDFYVDNYTEAVAVNTPFTTLSVQAAGNLTVRNFLDVEVFWPNQVTPVAGAGILVMDNSDTVWNGIAPSGMQSWILVTDRIYINSNAALENTTTVTVSYGSYEFLDNSRDVAMGESRTEPFFMDDQSAPTSAAVALPPYRNTLTFPVRYTASDGNGTGLGDVTLWFRTRGGGGWNLYATQPAGLEGQFTFTAPAEGVYEFATTVDDTSDNTQPGPSENHTWTIVDTTRPASRIVALPVYETALSFTVTWAPETGVTDIEKYTIQYNAGSGWVSWVTTASTSGTFTATAQGVYAFRSIATDHAGNMESAPSGNDTWTVVDAVGPGATNSPPLGANASRSPVINIIFTEPMDRNSVQQAFSISPDADGTFTWSADSRVLTFVPNSELAAATTHTVIIGTGASDLAGNQMPQPLTFQFTTVSAPASAALSIGDLWWLFLIVGAALGGGLLVLTRRRAAATAKPPVPIAAKAASTAIVEDLFLLNHRDGLLIKHETRRLRPDVDTDILTGMLTAVQAFVKDALKGDDYAELNEMTVGQMHIIIGRGKWLALAARIEGAGSQPWTGQIERCIKDMEDHHWDQLEDWDGDMGLARVLTPYLKKLLQGGYALVEV